MTATTILRGLGRNQAADRYIGRHRPDTIRLVSGDYSPLRPADRQALAPHHYADRQLPAGVDERTGRIDPVEVLALSQPAEPEPATGTRDDVLAEMLADLDATAAAAVAEIFAEVTTR